MKKASIIFILPVLLLSISTISVESRYLKKEMKTKKSKKSKSPKLLPDDIAVYLYMQGALEELFRLEKGSLVIPSDGKAFEKKIQTSDWSQYPRVGMQLSNVVFLAGNPKFDPAQSNELTILHRHGSGLYYQEIFVGHNKGHVGQLIAIVGISGNQMVGCSYYNTTNPPSPLVPKGGIDDACGLFLADLNAAICSYTEGDRKLAYDITYPISEDPITSGENYTRVWVSFSDLDVFADRDPNGNE